MAEAVRAAPAVAERRSATVLYIKRRPVRHTPRGRTRPPRPAAIPDGRWPPPRRRQRPAIGPGEHPCLTPGAKPNHPFRPPAEGEGGRTRLPERPHHARCARPHRMRSFHVPPVAFPIDGRTRCRPRPCRGAFSGPVHSPPPRPRRHCRRALQRERESRHRRLTLSPAWRGRRGRGGFAHTRRGDANAAAAQPPPPPSRSPPHPPAPPPAAARRRPLPPGRGRGRR